MKAMEVPFCQGYGSPLCSNRLQSDRPKRKGLLFDPRAFQSHAEIGLFGPGLNHAYPSENFKIFVSLDSSKSTLSNEIWWPNLLQEVTYQETKLERLVFKAGRNNSTTVM